jgi:hypothetical protein
MAKRKMKRRRSTTEKVIIVLGLLIAVSMILTLFAGFGAANRAGTSGSSLPLAPSIPVAQIAPGAPYAAAIMLFAAAGLPGL